MLKTVFWCFELSDKFDLYSKKCYYLRVAIRTSGWFFNARSDADMIQLANRRQVWKKLF